jgi:hypothetical protein
MGENDLQVSFLTDTSSLSFVPFQNHLSNYYAPTPIKDTMITNQTHRSERLVYRAIEPETDAGLYHKLRNDPSVGQFMLPFVCGPWTKSRAMEMVLSAGPDIVQ